MDCAKQATCGFPLYVVDAFTDEAFSGNPAAVCLLKFDQDLDDGTLQKIAAEMNEMNLSDTAFVQPTSDSQSFSEDIVKSWIKAMFFIRGPSRDNCSLFKLRWFTPTYEVELCGHATIASAAVLFFVLDNPSPKIIFESMSGPLITKKQDDCISMDFPLNKPLLQDKEEYLNLLQLVCPLDWVHSVHYSHTTKTLLVRFTDNKTRYYGGGIFYQMPGKKILETDLRYYEKRRNRSDLENLKPDTSEMVPTDNSGKVEGIIVSVIGSQQNGSICGGMKYDFLSRYFAPWLGMPEDPVTGSAHTVLAAYWSSVLNKNVLCARQCSPRGGDVAMTVRDNDVRVDLSGKAKVVLKGNLII